MVAGASLALLLFLKISYFAVGAGLVLFSMLADRRNMRRLIALVCGLAPITLAMVAFLRFDVPAWVHDLKDTVHARSAGLTHFGISDLLGLSTTSLIGLALALCFLGANGPRGRQRVMLLATVIYAILAEALFFLTNGSQGTARPLYIVLIFILLAELGSTLRTEQDGSVPFAAALVVLGLSFTAPAYFVDLRGLALLTKYKTSDQIQASAFHVEGDHLRDLAFYDNKEDEPVRRENGHFYTSFLNDGIDLLKKYSNSSDIVASLSYHNPFSYALLRRPPRAGSTWLLMDNNISPGHMLSDERMFGDATVVMVPKYTLSTHVATDEALFREYKPYLLSNFSFVAESKQWRLYRRMSGH